MRGAVKGWSFSTAAIVVGWAISIGVAIWAVSANRTATAAQLRANTSRIENHEERLHGQEIEVSRIATDVAWIRLGLERVGLNGDGE